MAETPQSARGVYGISVAAELAGVGEQTLRLYERKGLLTPFRTSGGTRRYSEDDMTVVLRVAELLSDGVNLTGIGRILELEAINLGLREQLDLLGGDDAPVQ